MTRLTASGGQTTAVVGEASFEIDADGGIEVPEHLVSTLESHGWVREPVRAEKRAPLRKENRDERARRLVAEAAAWEALAPEERARREGEETAEQRTQREIELAEARKK